MTSCNRSQPLLCLCTVRNLYNTINVCIWCLSLINQRPSPYFPTQFPVLFTLSYFLSPLPFVPVRSVFCKYSLIIFRNRKGGWYHFFTYALILTLLPFLFSWSNKHWQYGPNNIYRTVLGVWAPGRSGYIDIGIRATATAATTSPTHFPYAASQRPIVNTCSDIRSCAITRQDQLTKALFGAACNLRSNGTLVPPCKIRDLQVQSCDVLVKSSPNFCLFANKLAVQRQLVILLPCPLWQCV